MARLCVVKTGSRSCGPAREASDPEVEDAFGDQQAVADRLDAQGLAAALL